MKTHLIILPIIFLFTFNTFAGNRHLPWCGGNHTINEYDAECHGYAMARAYDRYWNHPVCPAQSFPGDAIQEAYFYKINETYQEFDYRLIQVGDILKFSDHAVYVRTVPGSPRYNNPNGIYVDHKLNAQVDYETSKVTLTSVINSGFGDPLYIYRKWNRWEIAVENSFEDGEVKVKGNLRNSGWTEPDLSFEEWVSLDAVEEGNSHGGYVQRFQDWEKNENPQSLGKSTSIEIVDDYYESVTWKAAFADEYNITFLNNFIGVGNFGEIKINNTLYNQPASVFNVIQGGNITAEALNQTYNSIIYSFSYWSDSLNNYTERTKTFYPSDHTSYTAYFAGKPAVVQNVQFDCDMGDPIKLVWNQHQNSSCNYRIYRKTRDQWGNTTGPDLLSTCSNGTTTYTDYDYIKASTYIDLASYDVRAYYTIEGTEANTNWKPLFGMPGLKTDSLNLAENGIESNPVSFKLSNYPNPFNPTTSINIGLPGKQKVKLSIYTITGEKVALLADRILERGNHQIVWDRRDQSGNQV